MKVEVRKIEGFFSVYVDDVRTVDRESFAVAHNVAHALLYPEKWEPTEAYEVADAILAWRRRAEDMKKVGIE